MSLTRQGAAPAPPMVSRKDRFDTLLDRFFSGLPFPAPAREISTAWSPNLDLSETDKEYVVRVEAPGMARDDLDVTLEGQVLSVAGQRSFEKEQSEEDYFWREREEGRFLRTVRLPSAVKAENVDARYADGVLTVRVQKAAPDARSRITVK